MRVVIAGAGSVGRSIARELLGRDHEVTIVDRYPTAMRIAQVADADLVARLAGSRSEGLVAEVTAATATGTTPDGDVRVDVTSTTSAHVRVAPTGERTDVPVAEARTVELVLRWTSGGWRVQDVREPGGVTP